MEDGMICAFHDGFLFFVVFSGGVVTSALFIFNYFIQSLLDLLVVPLEFACLEVLQCLRQHGQQLVVSVLFGCISQII
jgi:hypothetical protein